MKLNNIPSNTLPKIDDSIKECINLGRWLLFKSKSPTRPGKPVFFYLKAGSRIFELSEDGSIETEYESKSADLSIDEIFYFSDLPQPKSLSNMSMQISH